MCKSTVKESDMQRNDNNSMIQRGNYKHEPIYVEIVPNDTRAILKSVLISVISAVLIALLLDVMKRFLDSRAAAKRRREMNNTYATPSNLFTPDGFNVQSSFN